MNMQISSKQIDNIRFEIFLAQYLLIKLY